MSLSVREMARLGELLDEAMTLSFRVTAGADTAR